MSNIALSFEKDGSDGLTHNVQRGRKGTQNGIVRILGYQVLFFWVVFQGIILIQSISGTVGRHVLSALYIFYFMDIIYTANIFYLFQNHLNDLFVNFSN